MPSWLNGAAQLLGVLFGFKSFPIQSGHIFLLLGFYMPNPSFKRDA